MSKYLFVNCKVIGYLNEKNFFQSPIKWNEKFQIFLLLIFFLSKSNRLYLKVNENEKWFKDKFFLYRKWKSNSKKRFLHTIDKNNCKIVLFQKSVSFAIFFLFFFCFEVFVFILFLLLLKRSCFDLLTCIWLWISWISITGYRRITISN